jgi:soluble lytic murein transglycosylase-like protein
MQLIPSTAKRFGVTNSFNPTQNIEGGVKYLKYLLGLYDGNYAMAIAAYNAGEGAVARYGGIPPYAETRNYVSSVAKHLKTARQGAARKPAPAKPAEAPEYNPIQASIAADGKIYYRTLQP